MKTVQDRRVWIGGGVVIALLIAAASWFLLISPKLSEADAARSQAASTNDSNVQLQQRAVSLAAKSRHLDKYTASLRRALASLPADSGLPAFTRQIAGQARSSHVGLVSISVGSIAAATPSAPTAASPDPASPSPSPSASAPAPAASGGAGSVYSVQLTIISNGSMNAQRAFLRAVQYAGPRHGLVSSAQFAPVSGGSTQSIERGNKMTAQVTVFSAPQTPTQIANLRKLLSATASR